MSEQVAWNGQRWQKRSNGEVVRIEQVMLDGVHYEATVVEDGHELARAVRIGLRGVKSGVGTLRKLHGTALLRSWRLLDGPA